MTARERLAAVGSGADFIRALVGAWDCCGTCAGGVLAKHDAAVRAAVLDHLAAELGSDNMRETVAEALSCGPGHGEFMPYIETAVADHNRWSWRGDGHDPEDGTPSVMREAYRGDADAALGAVRAALGVSEA